MASMHFASDQVLPRIGFPPAPHRVRGEDMERDLLWLYEQLLATRLELGDGAGPAEGQVSLSREELDSLVAQLDTSIVATRHMLSSTSGAQGDSARDFDMQAAYGACSQR